MKTKGQIAYETFIACREQYEKERLLDLGYEHFPPCSLSWEDLSDHFRNCWEEVALAILKGDS